MTYRVPHIVDGIVVNISLSKTPGAIDGTDAVIGYRYENGQFLPPTRDLAKEKSEKIAAIKALRIAKSEGGMEFGGKWVPTDKEAIVLVDATRRYLDGKVGKKVKRAGLGTLDKATLDAYFEAMGALHDTVHARESDLFDAIMATTTTEQLDAIDIQAGW